MFHVKQTCFLILLVFGYALTFGQGVYTYKPVPVSIQLPADTSLRNPIERLGSAYAISPFEKDFIYYLNYVRVHPAEFRRMAVEPYLKAYPSLKAEYGESLLADLASFPGAGALSPSGKLFQIARQHSADLGRHDMMSHQSSDGTTTQQRFDKVGLLCGTECINMGDYPNALEVLLSLLIDYKVTNKGHRKSLLNPKMKSIGVGAGRNNSNTLQYTVADLGCD